MASHNYPANRKRPDPFVRPNTVAGKIMRQSIQEAIWMTTAMTDEEKDRQASRKNYNENHGDIMRWINKMPVRQQC